MGAKARPEGPSSEVRRAERGKGSWEAEFPPVVFDILNSPSPPARRSGERCKLPQWAGPRQSPGELAILHVF